MQKVVVMPVKNEAWILEKTLACLSLWADKIIIADQHSTDGSLEIYSKFSKVKVIPNPAVYHSSNVRKLLLDEVRKIEGEKVIFSFDADEIPTADFLSADFWRKIDSLPKGNAVEMQWVQLWRSPFKYRDDGSVWSNSWKVFGFVDDGKMEYSNINVVNDHTSRVPPDALNNIVRFEFPKVLHYQFTNWQRMLSKQAYYRMMEFLKSNQTWWSALKINVRYYATEDESNMRLSDVPAEWVQKYLDNGIKVNEIKQEINSWFDSEILKLFQQYGANKFAGLDIQRAVHVSRSKIRKLYFYCQRLLFHLKNSIKL